ncbi:hypothetical protein ACWGN5_25875 [Streptomyces sp. NPDC055815]
MEILMDRPLLSLRTTLVLLLALLAGGAAGGLTVLAGEGVPRSVLAGLAVAALAVPFFNRLVGAEAGEAAQCGHAVVVRSHEEQGHG